MACQPLNNRASLNTLPNTSFWMPLRCNEHSLGLLVHGLPKLDQSWPESALTAQNYLDSMKIHQTSQFDHLDDHGKPCLAYHNKTIFSKDSITCWFLSIIHCILECNITSTTWVGFSYLLMTFILAIAAKWYSFLTCFGLCGHFCPCIKRFAYQLTGVLTTYLGWCKKDTSSTEDTT